ncbi:unnamed protein product [Psylliodes chrysocephalus]|uniref:Uncharacterized protein n=1 Tax=Psylliodes chrysocephalus TaxID=3402493 RepID=A0A9P0GFV0_9CUCU|nr:unnamed protein product [Psylliodes chrysocephala]
MSCLGDCLDLGPPPDSILFLPPPPVPSFLQQSLPDLLLNTTPCSAAQICESTTAPNRIPESGDYMELPRKDVETWSGIGDTWLLVLVASSIGVLLLGALLAMFLLKCREMNMFGGNDCSSHRQMKNHPEPRECSGVPSLNGTKMVHPSDTVLYHGSNLQDNRMVWATLTPRGTQHFISENYPPDLIDYGDGEDHYETIDNVGAVPPVPPYPKALEKSSFDNSGFLDYEYEDPTPLIESYQLNNIEPESSHYQMIGNTDMRCSNFNTLRRHLPLARPRVSSPTRIEHPNLPPLNLYPHKGTLKKNGTLSYRAVEGNTLPKYGL